MGSLTMMFKRAVQENLPVFVMGVLIMMNSNMSAIKLERVMSQYGLLQIGVRSLSRVNMI